MMRVLTDWYPATIKPVRPGLYLAQWFADGEETYLDLFDGRNWCDHSGQSFMNAPIRWRGLAFDPEAAVFVPSGGKIVDIFYPDSSDAYVVEVPR